MAAPTGALSHRPGRWGRSPSTEPVTNDTVNTPNRVVCDRFPSKGPKAQLVGVPPVTSPRQAPVSPPRLSMNFLKSSADLST